MTPEQRQRLASIAASGSAGADIRAALYRIDQLTAALRVMLDRVDYCAGACEPTEMLAAVLPVEVLSFARRALGAS